MKTFILNAMVALSALTAQANTSNLSCRLYDSFGEDFREIPIVHDSNGDSGVLSLSGLVITVAANNQSREIRIEVSTLTTPSYSFSVMGNNEAEMRLDDSQTEESSTIKCQLIN